MFGNNTIRNSILPDGEFLLDGIRLISKEYGGMFQSLCESDIWVQSKGYPPLKQSFVVSYRLPIFIYKGLMNDTWITVQRFHSTPVGSRTGSTRWPHVYICSLEDKYKDISSEKFLRVRTHTKYCVCYVTYHNGLFNWYLLVCVRLKFWWLELRCFIGTYQGEGFYEW